MHKSLSQEFNTPKLVKFVLPSVIMMVFIAIYSMAGCVFASRFIGEYALSAINIVFPFISFALAVSVMFATGSNAIVSANLGEKNIQKAKENFTVITILSFLTSVAFMVVGLVFDDEIIQLLGATKNIIPYAKSYLQSYCISFPFLFLGILSQYFFVTENKAFMGMMVVIVGGLLNIFISYLLMGVLGIGIISVSIGSGIAYGVPALLFLVFFANKKGRILHFIKPKMHKKFILNACTNGSSEMVTNLSIAIITAIMNIIMGKMAGDIGIVAVSVIMQCQFFLASMFIGFGAGIAPVFGFAYGAKDKEQTRTVFRISRNLVAISSFVLVIICVLFHSQIVSAFINHTSEAFELSKKAFVIFAVGYLFVGTNIFSSIFFTSVSNGKISAIISFLRTFLFIIGMLAILPKFFGTTGVWLAIPCAEFLAIIVSVSLLKKYQNKYGY